MWFWKFLLSLFIHYLVNLELFYGDSSRLEISPSEILRKRFTFLVPGFLRGFKPDFYERYADSIFIL